ncbi:MAG: hypothetical protein UY34_C0008G0030 [Parcubacteria group bacterium GW2011_GWA2_48_9]|nr:MAG: hypothetical protein UY34_C0008G0030 [Parcubacteria group bacterium GW2011_GWA2_48_9]
MSTEEHHHDVITQVTEQFAEVYSGSSQGIYIFLDDHHYSLNNRLLGLLGYASTDEILADGKSFLEKLIEPQSQAKLVEAYQAAMQQMTGSTLSVSWLKKSATESGGGVSGLAAQVRNWEAIKVVRKCFPTLSQIIPDIWVWTDVARARQLGGPTSANSWGSLYMIHSTWPYRFVALSVYGLDLSEKLLDIAKKDNPTVEFTQGDMRQLPYADGQFDGVFAKASLLHIKKDDIDQVLSEIRRVLRPKGIFHAAVKQGEGEKEETEDDYGYSYKRFFSYWQPEEFKRLLTERGFNITNSDILKRSFTWIRIIAVKGE